MKKGKIFLNLFFSLIVLFCLNSFVFAATQEELTISTYYPAPYGVYQKLRLYPTATAPTCDDTQKGVLYYDQATNQMLVCKGAAELWQSAEGYWKLNAPNLATKDPAWSVWGHKFRTTGDDNYIEILGSAGDNSTWISSVSQVATQKGLIIGATGGIALPIKLLSSKVELASGLGNWLTVYGEPIGTPYSEIKAEGSDPNVSIILTPKGTGTVGLGTANPQYPLEVAGKVKFYNPTPGKEGSFMMFDYSWGNSAAITLTDYRGKNYLWFGAYDDIYGNLIYSQNPSTASGQSFGIAENHMGPIPRFVVNADETYLGYCLMPAAGIADSGGNGAGKLYVRSKIGIGTTAPAYALDVVGDINTTGDLRKNGTAYNNPDYVFEPKYNLIPIKDLKEYVGHKKHLPGMLSKDDINKEGVKIFEQNRLLTEKLEEAYLYIFQLENRLEKIENSVAELKK